jgi:hypothetical protein
MAPTTHPASSSRFVLFSFQSFQWLLLVFTGLVALSFAIEAVRFLPVQSDNMYPEAAGVLSAQRWAHGLSLYEDYRQAPYMTASFPPLWYGILAIAAKLGLNDLNALTLFGRLLSLLCLVGVAVFAFRWNRKIGYPAGLALLAPLFYLSLPILVPWAVTARPDFPALLLVFFALYLSSLRSTTTSSVAVAAALAAVGFLVRHNAVSVPVSVVLWLVWSRKWKAACIFCATWAAVVVPVIATVQHSSHGLLLLNISGAKFGEFALTYVRDVIGRLLVAQGHGFVIALFAFGIFGCIEAWRLGDKRCQLGCIYLVVSLGLAVLGSAARGAAANHYLEPTLALALLIPTGMSRLKAVWAPDSAFASLSIVMVLVLLLPALDAQRWDVMHTRPEDLRQIARLVENKSVLTDIPYLAARTSSLELLDPASLTNMERTGAWSAAGIMRELEEKKYELVVLSQAPNTSSAVLTATYPRYPHLDSKVQTAIADNYGLCFRTDTAFVYVPLSTDGSSIGSNCVSVTQTFPQGLAQVDRP